ncbi:DoxX family protein [Lacimicrobium sp. SS2-24]|uniref:DoxX family protein n=1 Tax=Lacimicrobium sp. SS2-24 TaxID=2005569 RepID=UPI000B4AA5C2|nr:DoxX family protein [Lacimicrobium sp. SS2-24]
MFISFVSGNKTLSDLATLFARVGLSAIFILAGMNKIQQYEGSAQYLASAGLPEGLLPLVILFELGGGLLLLAGGLTQLIALAFAGFSVVTALMYHFQLDDQMQFIMFFKNIAMAGGFLALAASGAGRFSLDQKLLSKTAKS